MKSQVVPSTKILWFSFLCVGTLNTLLIIRDQVLEPLTRLQIGNVSKNGRNQVLTYGPGTWTWPATGPLQSILTYALADVCSVHQVDRSKPAQNWQSNPVSGAMSRIRLVLTKNRLPVCDKKPKRRDPIPVDFTGWSLGAGHGQNLLVCSRSINDLFSNVNLWNLRYLPPSR